MQDQSSIRQAPNKDILPVFEIKGWVSKKGDITITRTNSEALASLIPIPGQMGMMRSAIKLDKSADLDVDFSEGQGKAFRKATVRSLSYAKLLIDSVHRHKLMVPEALDFGNVDRHQFIVVLKVALPKRRKFSLRRKWELKLGGKNEYDPVVPFTDEKTLCFGEDAGHKIIKLAFREGTKQDIIFSLVSVKGKKRYSTVWFKFDGFNIIGPLTAAEKDYYLIHGAC